MGDYFAGITECFDSPQTLPKAQRERFEHNLALAIRHHTITGAHVVPLRPACGSPLELWGGPGNINKSFLAHMRQDPVPAIGREILNGAWMPDGTIHGGGLAPTQLPIAVPVAPPPQSVTAPCAPKPKSKPKSKPKQKAAPSIKIESTPDKATTTLAKARAAIARGVSRETVLKVLRAAGITTEI